MRTMNRPTVGLAIAAAIVFGTAAQCTLVDPETGKCPTPIDDRIFVDNGVHPTGYWCFDDGDDYPTVYRSATTVPAYPTVG